MIRRPPRSTLFPYTRSSDLPGRSTICNLRSEKFKDSRGGLAEEAAKLANKTGWQFAKNLLGKKVVACAVEDRKSTRLNSSHGYISYAVFCLKNKSDSH